MSQTGSWNGIIFEVSPNVIRGYTGLTIEGGSETEDKVSNKYAYVKRKNSTPTAVNLDVYLNAYLGCNVRDEAMAFIKAATDGAKNYFYVNGKKLVNCKLMLVSAKVSETTVTPMGVWTSCKVSLSMKQCEKYSGSSSGSSSSGSSKKTSQSKKGTVKQQSWIETNTDATKKSIPTIGTVTNSTLSKVISKVVDITSPTATVVSGVGKSSSTTSSTASKKAENFIAKKVSDVKKVESAAKKATETKKTTTVQKPAAMKTSTAKSKIDALEQRRLGLTWPYTR